MTTTITNPTETANEIMAKLPDLSEYAAREARLWTNYGKVRIYFGKQYAEIRMDGICVPKGSPYGICRWLSDLGYVVYS